MKIGGPARFLLIAKTADDIRAGVIWTAEQKLPLAVLGNGSNTLVADSGFPGLVIIMGNDQLEWASSAVIAGAGVKLGQLIGQALQHGLGGLDWLIGVPGTVGGSIFGNAGSRDQAIGDYVVWVETVSPGGQVRKVLQADCGFEYRSSIFKKQPGSIILRAELRLPQVDAKIERQTLAAMAKKKNKNQPVAASSAGCMFTNPKVTADQLPADLRQLVNPDGSVSAWRLIAAAGLQGRQLGQMQISPRHANFMVNLGGGTADHVVQLLSLVKQQVRDKLGVQLQEEVRYLGF